MKPYLKLCAEVMSLIFVMISGAGCAQTYGPRRYYGTTYTTVPRVYTFQPVATYSQPVVTYSQPSVTYRTPSSQYRTTYTTPAEIEARVKRQTQEIEERVRRQTEEIQRQIARQTAETARQLAQSAMKSTYTAAATSPLTAKDLTYADTSWMGQLPSGVTYYPNVKVGGGFVPHVFGNDMSALLVWPVSVGDDVGDAVRNLVAVKNDLHRTEPAATLGMVLLVCSGRVPDVDKWLAQGVQCLDATQFPAFSASFFSQAASQSPSCGDVSDGVATAHNEGCESSGESNLDAIVAKVREWSAVATNFLQTAPWWVWVSGVALLFVVVFLLSVRDARSQPFQTRNDNPWVIDPSDN